MSIFQLLVADDQPDVVASITKYLLQLADKLKIEMNVRESYSGTATLRHLSENHIDAVFLDYDFKDGIGGDEIIDLFYDPFGHTLIILMSGREELILQRIIDKGKRRLGSRFQFLRKPFDILEVQDRLMDIIQFCKNRPYPLPVSYAYSLFEGSSLPQAKFQSMLRLTTEIVRYTAAIILAECKLLNVPVAGSHQGSVRHSLLSLLSLVDLAIPALHHRRRECFMPEIVTLFHDTDAQGTLWTLVSTISDYAPLKAPFYFEGYYRKVISDYESKLVNLYRDMSFLALYTLVVPKSLVISEGQDCFEYITLVHMGQSIYAGATKMRTHHPISLDFPYLTFKNRLLPLSPYAAYDFCETCSSGCVHVCDSVSGNRIRLVAHCNHESTIALDAYANQPGVLDNEWRHIMDSITAAILGALVAGALAGIKSSTEQSIQDAYAALKGIIMNQYGRRHSLITAIGVVENQPGNADSQKELGAELMAAGVNRNVGIIEAANTLLICERVSDTKRRTTAHSIEMQLRQVEALQKQADMTIDAGDKTIIQAKVDDLWDTITKLQKNMQLGKIAYDSLETSGH